MNTKTTTPLAATFRGVLTQPSAGVVGLVDELLAVCREHVVELDWQADRFRFRPVGANWEELGDLAIPKAVFRAVLARIAVLCNEETPNAVSPYGGQGHFSGGTGSDVFRVKFSNTSSQQSLELGCPQPHPS